MIVMRNADPFRLIHVGSLALCLVFLPWSTALLSMAQMVLALNWIIEGVVRRDSGERWSRAFGSAPSLLFLGFFGLHVIGLSWTSREGMSWGLDLVRILLPVLVFTVILSGSPRSDLKAYRFILLAGAWSVIGSTIVCMLMRGMSVEYRELSAFISHIRLGLLLCMSIVILLYFLPGAVWLKVLHFAAVIWALIFLNFLGSIQAFGIMLVVGVAVVWRRTSLIGRPQRAVYRLLAIAPFLAVTIWTIIQLRDRYSNVPAPFTDAPEYSQGGERYVYSTDNSQMENGNLVWSQIAWAEVERTWYKRSEWPLDSLDGRGHLLYPTLFRYLASRGLPKDSAGIMSLSDHDIERVENGIPNVTWGEGSRLRDRFDEVMFELDQYVDEGRVSGHSLTMRLEFWKAGTAIAAKNLLFGVGTGDTQVAFDRQYDEMNSKLGERWRYRAHNQYLTLLISFGMPGFLFAMFSLWWPAGKLHAWRNTLFMAWAIIAGIGSLTDDTIETQAGATFFAFYYAFFVFAAPRQADHHKEAEPILVQRSLATPPQ